MISDENRWINGVQHGKKEDANRKGCRNREESLKKNCIPSITKREPNSGVNTVKQM